MSAAEPQVVRFPCEHCGRILKADESLRGTQQRCARCRKKVTVPALADSTHAAPAAPPQASDTTSDRGADDASLEMYAPGEAAPAEQVVYVPVHCRLCDTRMYATLAEVGQEVRCPDCGAKTKVPPPKEKPTAGAALPPPGSDYELSEPPPPLTMETIGFGKKVPAPPVATAAAPREKSKPQRRREKPRHAFTWLLGGFFAWKFYQSVIPTALLAWGLTTGGIVLTLLFGSVPLFGMGAVASVLGMVVSMILLLLAANYLGGLLVTIVETSSDGVDSVEQEFEEMFADRFWRTEFISAAWTYATLPGIALYALLRTPLGLLPVDSVMFLLGSAFLFLPLTQLSLLEASSLIVPISFNLARSIRYGWRGWLAFYVIVAPVVALAISVRHVLESGQAGGSVAGVVFFAPVTFAAAVALGIAALILYYRLLGRLACYCAERTPPRVVEEKIDERDPYRPLYP